MTKSYPTISLCMITKDEEDFIAQAIKSVSSIVCETIIVDTGSTDRTVQIARDLGATVLFREWDNDFSAPRNIGIGKASGDWILVLDGDEAIAERDLKILREHTLEEGTCFQITQRHYSNDHRLSQYVPVSGEYSEWERNYKGFFESGLVRLFPNFQGLNYQGRIHELVEPSIQQIGKHKIVISPVHIHHYGHTEEVRAKKDKNKLYAPLGKAKLQDDPTDWKSYFELGVEQNKPGQQEESVLAFKRSISLNPNYVPTWINMGYVLCELERYQEAIQAQATALKLDPQSHEAHCNLGVVFMRTKNWGRAEYHFREAIKLNVAYVNAYFNLSKVYASINRLSEAVFTLNRLLEHSPKNPQATADLGALYLMGGNFSHAEELLFKALKEDPTLESARDNIGKLFSLKSNSAMRA